MRFLFNVFNPSKWTLVIFILLIASIFASVLVTSTGNRVQFPVQIYQGLLTWPSFYLTIFPESSGGIPILFTGIYGFLIYVIEGIYIYLIASILSSGLQAQKLLIKTISAAIILPSLLPIGYLIIAFIFSNFVNYNQNPDILARGLIKYPNANSWVVRDGKVYFVTKDSFDEIKSYYQEQLIRDNWKFEGAYQDQYLISFSKGAMYMDFKAKNPNFCLESTIRNSDCVLILIYKHLST